MSKAISNFGKILLEIKVKKSAFLNSKYPTDTNEVDT